MIFLICFLKELKNGVKYLFIGMAAIISVLAILMGISWGVGFFIDKILNIEQLNPSNYIVYGSYAIISILLVSTFLVAILIWIVSAYKYTVDRLKQGK